MKLLLRRTAPMLIVKPATPAIKHCFLMPPITNAGTLTALRLLIPAASYMQKILRQLQIILISATRFTRQALCIHWHIQKRLQRKDAMQLVVNLGGQCGDNVTAKTNYLILGNNDFCSLIKDGKSNKQKKAESLILKGKDIQILCENVFYDLVLNQ